jgi:phosphoribosylglycinamide formyltransferase-1
MNEPKKVLVFLSGRGSNCRALIQYQNAHPNCGYEIIGVITDKPGAPGLYYVREAKIPVYEFFKADYPDKESFLKALFTHAENLKPDIYALAGFMVIVPAFFIQAHSDHIINIHPSLLPDYPGLNTHERAISDKRKEHGCTVHLVSETIDGGAIIAQSKVSITSDDTTITLAAKVLVEEHRLYSWSLSMIALGKVTLTNGTVSFTDQAKAEALSQNFQSAPTL